MKKWITDHPYFFVSAIFLAILFIGWQFLYWQEDKFAFLLLLYMIVILGIRMAVISLSFESRPTVKSQIGRAHV